MRPQAGQVKRSRDRAIRVFEPAMEARSLRRASIEHALAFPAESEAISLVYQPVVDAASGRIVGFEALARWTHPTLGVVPAAEFIPLAEQAGITGPMTTRLLSLALAETAQWPDHVGRAFNLSAGELASPGIAARILEVVASHGFDPRRLSIEVTETALLSDFETARAALGRLRDGGVRILLDDFGAGFASIGYLREIRFDGIKLDGSLIATLLESTAAHELHWTDELTAQD